MNIKYTPVAVAIRSVQEKGNWRGRGRYGVIDFRRYGGRGRGSKIFGRSRGRRYSPKLGYKVITIINGKMVEYHSSIKFSDGIYHQMTNDQQENIHIERK